MIRHAFDTVRALVVAALVLLAAAPAGAQDRFTAPASEAPDDSTLAVYTGGRVTPVEFSRAWQGLMPNERPPGDRIVSKRVFLRSVVDRELLAIEATKTPLVITANETAELERTRRQYLQNELFTVLTRDLPAPTPDELDRFRRRKSQIAEIRFITFPTWESARSWRSRLLTGTPMTALDSWMERGGPDVATAEAFRWVAAEQIPDTLAQTIWAMRPGQVSDVLSFANHPVVIHLRNYQARPGATSPDGALGLESEYRTRQLDRARQSIREDLATRARREFVDPGMDVLLRGYLLLPPRNDVDSATGTPVMRPSLPLPVFTAADTGHVIARTRHGELTLVSYLRYWSRVAAYTRPEIRERGPLEASVDRVALEEEILEMAIARGIDRDPGLAVVLEKQREGFALDHYYAANFEAGVKVDEAGVRALFDAQPGHYDDPELLEARLIMVDREELADSLLKLIRGGRSFADLAREHSLDTSTSGDGGKTGIIRRGTNTNIGLEDAMFNTAVGAFGGPERTPEGWILWKVERHDPGKKRTLEEAREWVERDYRILESDRMLAAHLEKLRVKARVRIFDERVTEQLGAGGSWGD